MKIAIVTQYYAPEPVPIAQSVAHGLRDRGHEVRVVTAFPNYPAGVLYDGYTQRGGHFEDDEGVRIHRARIFISHSNSAVGRVLNYLSFGFASFRAWAFVRESDVVYCYATQMTAAIGPDLWYRFRKMPYVMHVQDLWPESVTGSSMIGGQRIQKAVAALLRP